MHRRRRPPGNSNGRLALWLSWLTALGLLLLGGSSRAEPVPATPPGQPVPILTRSITFTNTHTGETVTARYFAGTYDPMALAELNRVLRDHRTNEVGSMDPTLFDYLYDVAASAGVEPHFEVISGFRSATSNAMLRQKSSGVSEKSQHLLGKAIDVRLRGVRTSRLRDLALELKRGGVGYYERSDFVHLDTGRVRRWAGGPQK